MGNLLVLLSGIFSLTAVIAEGDRNPGNALAIVRDG